MDERLCAKVVATSNSVVRFLSTSYLLQLEPVATAIAQATTLTHCPVHFTAINPTPFLALLQAFLSA
jgi:hypothetical protein